MALDYETDTMFIIEEKVLHKLHIETNKITKIGTLKGTP